MSKPIAVLISDVHYSIHTLELADAAMRQAIDKANELNLALIIAGDLHDTKANIRGECIIAMRRTLARAKNLVWVLRGNHDSLNEKSIEHSLNFLPINCYVVATPQKYDAGLMKHWIGDLQAYLIPYFHDPEELKQYLSTVPKDSLLIMHQGVQTSESGHYIQDKSALPKECFEDFRVISGHYHTRQTIKCGRPRKGAVGLFDYIGNPYTLNFGEVNDPPKGYQILMDDGTLEFVPTNLRKHVIAKIVDSGNVVAWGSEGKEIYPGDLVWVKVFCTKENMKLWTKDEVSKIIEYDNFKLELIPSDTKSQVFDTKNLTQGPLLDALIDGLTNTSDDLKIRLKSLWKDLCE